MPSCTLGELSALEAIFDRLAAAPDRKLSVGRLMRTALAFPMAEYRRMISGAPGDAGRHRASDAGRLGDQGGGEGASGAAGERRMSRLAFQLMRCVGCWVIMVGGMWSGGGCKGNGCVVIFLRCGCARNEKSGGRQEARVCALLC